MMGIILGLVTLAVSTILGVILTLAGLSVGATLIVAWAVGLTFGVLAVCVLHEEPRR